jgi:hypothetical protein
MTDKIHLDLAVQLAVQLPVRERAAPWEQAVLREQAVLLHRRGQPAAHHRAAVEPGALWQRAAMLGRAARPVRAA